MAFSNDLLTVFLVIFIWFLVVVVCFTLEFLYPCRLLHAKVNEKVMRSWKVLHCRGTSTALGAGNSIFLSVIVTLLVTFRGPA